MSASDELTPPVPPKSSSRVILSTWLIVTHILAIGSFLPWGGLVFCSLLSYPSDDWNLSRILFLGTFYGYPLIILAVVIFSRYAYKKGWDRAAWVASTLSILPLIWLVLVFYNVL